MEAQLEYTVYTLHALLGTFGANLYAQSVLIKKKLLWSSVGNLLRVRSWLGKQKFAVLFVVVAIGELTFFTSPRKPISSSPLVFSLGWSNDAHAVLGKQKKIGERGPKLVPAEDGGKGRKEGFLCLADQQAKKKKKEGEEMEVIGADPTQSERVIERNEVVLVLLLLGTLLIFWGGGANFGKL